ncbi:MAG: PBP1A family penicillin-binding protein [Bacillota bacterium]
MLLGLTAGFLLLVVGAALAVPLPPVQVPEASVIYDHRGRPAVHLYVQKRVEVPLSRIPRHLQQAVLAIEDEHFYRHPGINPLAIVRALIRNLQAGRIVEGGSTITQQLAKNLTGRTERTLIRKAYEALVTIKLEILYRKTRILEAYLNTIYFGHGAYGVEVAAQTYFGHGASEVDLPEAALLAGLIRSPENYSPYRDPEAALRRRNLVLDRMVQAGMITPLQAQQAKATAIRLAGLRPPGEAGYFGSYVVSQLGKLYPELTGDIYRAGYRIYTTLDLDMQRAAEKAVAQLVPERGRDAQGIPQPQVALVALEPSTGYIRAMVGGRDYSVTQLNRAAPPVRRQPGSAFKPFLYAALIDGGHTVVEQQVCEPVAFPGPTPDRPWVPTDYTSENHEPYHYRPLMMREALKVSDNVVASRWCMTLGPSRLARYARLMGIQSPLEPVGPLALGASPVSPLELAAAYCTLANGGYRVTPSCILRVEDSRGRVLLNPGRTPPPREKVIDERVAYIVTDLLRSVLSPGGTAGRVGAVINRPAAGKTGTTDELRDAWFVGYTPDLLAAVWVGYDDGSTSLWSTGGAIAAPVWAAFMSSALHDVPPREFPVPRGISWVQVSAVDGLLPNPSSPVVTEVFLAGTEPTAVSPVWWSGTPPPWGWEDSPGYLANRPPPPPAGTPAAPGAGAPGTPATPAGPGAGAPGTPTPPGTVPPGSTPSPTSPSGPGSGEGTGNSENQGR